MKKVVIFGEIYSPNVGDGLIYESIQFLLREKTVVAIPCDLSGRSGWQEESDFNTEKTVGLFRKICRIPLRRSRLMRRIYTGFQWFAFTRQKMSSNWSQVIMSADAVIIGGGQLLTDINFGFPPKIYEITKLAERHGKPLAIFGCGVGSAGWGWLATKMYSDALSYASYVSCRDVESANIINRYVSQLNVRVHPDPAFIVGSVYEGRHSKVSGPGYSIGFNFQDVNHFRVFVPTLKNISDDEYIDFWVSVIADAEEAGNSPMIFTNGDPEDFVFANLVHRKLVDLGSGVTLCPRPCRPIDLVSDISKVTRLVVTRMHAGIAGFGLGKAVLSISWDKKIDGVWRALNLGDIVLPAAVLTSNSNWFYFQERFEKLPNTNIDSLNIKDTIVIEMDKCCTALGLR